MNNRERWLATMRYGSVDHPPLIPSGGWATTARRWEEEGKPKGVTLTEYFNLPPGSMHCVGARDTWVPSFEETILEETDEYVVKINRRGVKERNLKDQSSMPEFLEYPIKGRESLPMLRARFDRDAPGRIDPDWLEKAEHDREAGNVVFGSGGMYFGFLNEHMGTAELLYTYFDDPEFIHEFNDLFCGVCESNLRRILPHFQLDTIAYHEDMAYRNGSIISPVMFKEFLTPYYKRIQPIVREFDIDLQWLDCDGNIWELIPLWLDLGINILLPMEVAAGMDVVALRKEFGRELRMAGGFDKRILAAGKKEISAELERIRPVVEDGGYIPSCDHGVPPDVSWENYCHFINGLKSMFGMG